jgi:hypothetical protein
VKYTLKRARRFAALALGCVQREFPCNPAHVIRGLEDVQRPRALHPAFYGCFDWHSAVHGHWLLVHLLRRFPALPEASAVRAALASNLTAPNLRTEADYLASRPYFERPYGWAWLLKLARELGEWDDPDARRWLECLQPLAGAIELEYVKWLPKQTYPIRSGAHANTAFGIAFALDYARAAERSDLEKLLRAKALEYFSGDRDYPATWEPGGNDFLSPCLTEAVLMRRVLPGEAFRRWFGAFLPAIPGSLLEPARVSDRTDGQLVHLDGLNLSRAACFFSLSTTLEDRGLLKSAAQAHLEAGLAHVASGHYEGEHWLATFAAHALACASEA